MKLHYTPTALKDLRAVHAYTESLGDTQNTEVFMSHLRLQVETLTDFPSLGKPGREEGTREFVVPKTPYIVSYYIEDDNVRVLAIVHNSRRWPGSI